MSALWQSMLAAQKEIKNPVKDSKNPHFKNEYASLESVIEAVKSICNKNNLVLTQEIVDSTAGFVKVITRVTHAPSGESHADSQTLPVAKNDPQGYGSAISYARRYGINAFFVLAQEDDDANDAAGKNEKPAPKTAAVINFDKPAPVNTQAAKDMADKVGKALGGFVLPVKK